MKSGSLEDNKVTVSIIVPIYSGALYLDNLIKEVAGLGERWELESAPIDLAEAILVDDSAIDDSPAIADRLAREHAWVSVLHLARNFGQHPATIAGILHSSGDWVVTLDEDLQHPPARIDELLHEATRASYDVVYANAETAVHDSAVRDWGSALLKGLVARLGGNRNIRYFSSFRLIRGPIARAASSVCGHETYFDIALSWFTERVSAVRMPLKDRRVVTGGQSGYRLLDLMSHARRMLMSSRIKIMRIGGAVGLLALLASLVFGGFVLVREMLSPGAFLVRGWASLIVTVVFFGGLLTFMIGIALEYLAVLVLQAQGKPIFFIVDRTRDAVVSQYFDRRTAK